MEEVRFLLSYLFEKQWVMESPYLLGTIYFTVTVDGYGRIAEQEVNPSSDQVFVAMWFDDSMEEAYERGIYPAIKRTGYNPFRIDKKPDVDKIDDEIIGEIRRSRFLVADFTYGEKGIRGGVYYEAGFALGLDLEVIRSCRADQIADLHFDVNHHYHIAWNTPEELREGLERRILALVGEGPNRENIPPRSASLLSPRKAAYGSAAPAAVRHPTSWPEFRGHCYSQRGHHRQPIGKDHGKRGPRGLAPERPPTAAQAPAAVRRSYGAGPSFAGDCQG